MEGSGEDRRGLERRREREEKTLRRKGGREEGREKRKKPREEGKKERLKNGRSKEVESSARYTSKEGRQRGKKMLLNKESEENFSLISLEANKRKLHCSSFSISVSDSLCIERLQKDEQ